MTRILGVLFFWALTALAASQNHVGFLDIFDIAALLFFITSMGVTVCGLDE